MKRNHQIKQAPPKWGWDGSAEHLPIGVFGATRPASRTVGKAGPALATRPRFRSLLVPVDGTPFGEHALPLALGIARRAGAEVQVVHVHRPMRSSFQTTFQPDRLDSESDLDVFLRERQEAYLDDLIRRLRRVADVPVRPVFLQGWQVVDELCAAASAGTDLVVMATHGRGLLGRLWSGSVADALMRRLSVPLLLARGYDAPVDLTGDPVPRHVLVPLDGSELAATVLEPALALGALADADHTLLQVVPTEPGGPTSGAAPLIRPRREEASDHLRRALDRWEGLKPRVRRCIVYEERPGAAAILDHARAHDADLIAMATSGRGGLTRLLRGDVTDEVVRNAEVPVLVYRSNAEHPEEKPCEEESRESGASARRDGFSTCSSRGSEHPQ